MRQGRLLSEMKGRWENHKEAGPEDERGKGISSLKEAPGPTSYL
jgi:hypothetical protein